MRHLLLIILSLLTVPATVSAQLHGYNTGFQLSRSNFCDTIPIHMENHQVYLEGVMEGRRVRFNLDTGSSQGMVNSDAPISYMQELGNVVSRDANGRKDTLKVVVMPPFQLGSLTVRGYVATVAPRRSLHADYDAILGFDLFNKGLCAKIDVRRKRMILTDRRHAFDNEPGYALKYKLKWFVPYVPVSPFMRHMDRSLFDLGSRQLYTMNKASFDSHAYKSKQVNAQVEGRARGHLAIGNYGAEAEDEVVFLKLNRLKWDDFSFLDVRAVTTQGPSRVGAAILDYGCVIINPFRRKIIFQPYDRDSTSTEVGNAPMSIAFVPHDGRAAVGLIWQESKAYKAGFRQGDIILSIDGKPIRSFRQFVDYPFVEGQKNRFLVRDRQGKTKLVVTER